MKTRINIKGTKKKKKTICGNYLYLFVDSLQSCYLFHQNIEIQCNLYIEQWAHLGMSTAEFGKFQQDM